MHRLLPFAIALTLAACTGSEVAETSAPVEVDPVAVATEWIQAVAANDVAALQRLVEPRGLAAVAAVESNLRSAEFVALVESGIPEELSAQYWSQFRDDFAAFSGTALADLSVGDEQAVNVPEFTAVELVGADGAGAVVLRRGSAGWQVDFPATMGPSLIGPLGEYLASAVDGEFAGPIADVYRDVVAPGLDAALALDPANSRLGFEAEYIRQLAESVAPTP